MFNVIRIVAILNSCQLKAGGMTIKRNFDKFLL